jgi:hypothetical protein
MHDRHQNADAQLALNMRRVARQSVLDCQEGLAAQDNGMPQKQPILPAQLSEFRLIEARG